MSKGAVWWLFVITLLRSTAPNQGEITKSTINLDLALLGHDPLLTDVLDQPDQGTKSTLFTAWQRESIYDERTKDIINSFVDVVQRGRCTPSLTEAIAINYEAYKSLTSEAISFATEGDATSKLGDTQFSFQKKAGLGNVNNPNAVLIRQHLEENHGEARFVRAECVTHTVRILPFHEPVLTPAFLTALQVLNSAALDTDSDARQNIYREFVRYYGTHFARTAHFGYVAYLGKLFATQANTTAEKAARRKCMLESAIDTLTPEVRKKCETTSQHFTRVVADKCGEEEMDVLVTEIGSRSASGVDDCHLSANESPMPVAYTLAKITGLFEQKWISSQTTDAGQTPLNGTALSAFFEEMSGPESQVTIEKAETLSAKQCSWRRTITPNLAAARDIAKAGVESSSSVNGGIVIVGGYPLSTANSLALFGPAPPLFPVEVHSNSLVTVHNTQYSCGGYNNAKLCWYLDTRVQDTWQSFDIPWSLIYHRAVVVNDDIWFFVDSKLRILHTRNTADKFREIDLGFSFSYRIGAVTHDSKTFVIGAGSKKDEIFVNADPNKPEQWELFSRLLWGRYDFGYVVFGSDIFVTGGCLSTSGPRVPTVEAISVTDGTVRSISPLSGPREDHEMVIIHGRPAVVGGYNGTLMATIETYDEASNSWETLGYSLSEPRYLFGLTQSFE